VYSECATLQIKITEYLTFCVIACIYLYGILLVNHSVYMFLLLHMLTVNKLDVVFVVVTCISYRFDCSICFYFIADQCLSLLYLFILVSGTMYC